MNDALWVDDGSDPLLDEVPVVKPGKTSESRKARRLRNTGLYAPVPLTSLMDRAWDAVYHPRTRLFLYLWVRSHQGQQSVKLTNAMAAEIGLDKQQKWRYLRQLKDTRRIAITQDGNNAPTIVVQQLNGQ